MANQQHTIIKILEQRALLPSNPSITEAAQLAGVKEKTIGQYWPGIKYALQLLTEQDREIEQLQQALQQALQQQEQHMTTAVQNYFKQQCNQQYNELQPLLQQCLQPMLQPMLQQGLQQGLQQLTQRIEILEHRQSTTQQHIDNLDIKLLANQQQQQQKPDQQPATDYPNYPKNHQGWTVSKNSHGFIRVVKRFGSETVCRSIGKLWDEAKADRVIAEYYADHPDKGQPKDKQQDALL